MNRDERLALLLTELSNKARGGTLPEIEDAAREHPDLADELRQLWAIAQFADMASKPVKPHPPSSPLPLPLPSFQDFELQSELGRGGMGVVYLAKQKSLNRLVALKLIRGAQLASPAERSRFKMEAEAAARLAHPNIVTVYEVGDAEGQAYLCMEYVEGPSLSEWIDKHGPLMPRDAAAIAALIARGVQHAHEHGILHRDLKPANVLIRNADFGVRNESLSDSALRPPHSDIQPKITDFGLAKKIDGPQSLTRTGLVVGTPGYMAPEQATGRKELTALADIYSLGAILYEMLTGHPPFQASSPVDTLLMVIEQDVIPPRQLNPSVDRDLEMICLKCLQKPPGLRYASAAALADDLDAYRAGETVSTRPSGLGYVISRMLRETHHAEVLENWGVLWMWHSLMIFLLCLLTQVMSWYDLRSPFYYLALWTGGLLTWGTILWKLRRRAGPVLFVERQIAHAWAAGVSASIVMFVIEVLGGLPVLSLSPAIAVAAGMVFVFKAGILSGQFYIYAVLNFLIALVMPLIPDYGILLFGIASAVSFFFPGLKYYRQLRDKGKSVNMPP